MGCHQLGLHLKVYTKTKLRPLRDSEWIKVASCSKMQLRSWAVRPNLASMIAVLFESNHAGGSGVLEDICF